MHTGLSEFSARLAALPAFEPPPGGWQSVLAAGQRRSGAPPRWPIAAAASVLAGAVGLVWLLQSAPSQLVIADRSMPGPAAFAGDAVRLENDRLERLLAALPESRAMRGSTAFTVSQLEDRLVVVDDRLSRILLEPNAPEYAERLWRERVEVMNSLVQVRYADAADPF